MDKHERNIRLNGVAFPFMKLRREPVQVNVHDGVADPFMKKRAENPASANQNQAASKK